MDTDYETLQFLTSLDIDGISIKSFDNDSIFIHKGNLVGLYSLEKGLVLEPEYWEIQCLEYWEKRCLKYLLKVGVVEKSGREIRYGGYSVSEKCWIIPPVFTIHEFWTEFDKYRRANRQG